MSTTLGVRDATANFNDSELPRFSPIVVTGSRNIISSYGFSGSIPGHLVLTGGRNFNKLLEQYIIEQEANEQETEEIDEIVVVGDPLFLDNPFTFTPEPSSGLLQAHNSGRGSDSHFLKICESLTLENEMKCNLEVEKVAKSSNKDCSSKSNSTSIFSIAFTTGRRTGFVPKADLDASIKVQQEFYTKCVNEVSAARKTGLANCAFEAAKNNRQCIVSFGG